MKTALEETRLRQLWSVLVFLSLLLQAWMQGMPCGDGKPVQFVILRKAFIKRPGCQQKHLLKTFSSQILVY